MKYPTVEKKPVFLKFGFRRNKITGRIDFKLKVMPKRTYSATKLMSL